MVRKFREHPLKVPESCFMGVSQIHFQPREGTIQQQQIIQLTLQILIVMKITFEHFVVKDLLKVS